MAMKVFCTHVLPVSTIALVLGLVATSSACSEKEPYSGYFLLEAPVPTETTEPTVPVKDDEPAAMTPVDDAGVAPLTCDTAKHQLLAPVDKTSIGEVRVAERPGVSNDAGVVDGGQGGQTADGGQTAIAGQTVVIVDATAGGYDQASKNARTYLNLASKERVDVTDLAAEKSTVWDIALKRATIFTNSGDAGPGQGGALFLAGKTWTQVTKSTLQGKTFKTESFVDDQCTPKADEIGAPETTFTGWYEYEGASMRVTPKKGIYVVRRGATFFKVEIQSYYGDASLNVPQSGGMYVLRVGEITE